MSTTTIPPFIQSAFEAFNAGDPEPLIELYAAEDVLVIGTDDSWHDQPAAIAQAFRSEVGHARVDWDPRTEQLGDDGQLLTGRVAFVMSDGTILHARATFVLRRDGEDWRIAHSHVSLPQSS